MSSLSELLKEKEMTDGRYELSLAEYVRLFAESGEEVTISGRGTSMLPTISEECTLVMAPVPDGIARAGDILLYTRPNSQPVIHRVWRVTDNGYDMVGDNQFLIERCVEKTAAVAYVRTINYPDGTHTPGHVGAWRIRMRYAYRYGRYLAGRIYRKIVRR